MKETLKKLESKEDKWGILPKFKRTMDRYYAIPLPNPCAVCIESDKDLANWFATFRWDPNEMAREVTAKLLDVSEETIRGILYRKKSKA